MSEALDRLTDKYNQWINENNLPAMSADELAWEDCVNAEQHKWLRTFCEEWELAQ